MGDWFQDYVVDTYSQIARHFDKTRYGIWPEMRWFSSLLPANVKALDIGSGNGRNAFHLAETAGDVMGIDVVPEMVRVAAENAEERGLDNISFALGDIRQLSFQDNSFDAVVCIASLHHLPTKEERKKAMEECWRVLKPGGIALLSVWAREQALYASATPVEDGEEGDVLIPWTRELDKKIFHRYYHLFSRGEFEDMVKSSSWNGVVFSHAHNHHVFGRKEGAVALEEVPEDLVEEV